MKYSETRFTALLKMTVLMSKLVSHALKVRESRFSTSRSSSFSMLWVFFLGDLSLALAFSYCKFKKEKK